ncbi:MAG: cation:proton antiporter [Patescibacteria group bacterium]|nr:cation:proton antiporter [Patescibacteria group bacterium]
MSLFVGIAAAVILAALCAFLVSFLKQPTITGFIIAGLIIGYFGYSESFSLGTLNSLASIGIALLLFIVGLEMDLRSLSKVGWRALLIGSLQMILTFAAGLAVAGWLGFVNQAAFYIAIAVTFSSTIVVVKIYSEKRELNSLHGKISLSVLLLQDLAAIIVLMLSSNLHDGMHFGWPMLFTFIRGAVFVALVLISSKVMPAVLDFLGKSRELLYLFGLAWGLGVALLAGLQWFGLSIEVGGFLAGLALASSIEHLQIKAELRPLRDFFLILFFVGLGADAFYYHGLSYIWPAVVISIFVLMFKPILIFFISNLAGYRSKTSFYTGLSLGQVSEFGLIIAALALAYGEISGGVLSIITLSAVITIFVSSYFITFDSAIYSFMGGVLRKFEMKNSEDEQKTSELEGHIVLVGAHRMGRSILEALENDKENIVVVDIDPEVVKGLLAQGIKAVYGDIADTDVREAINMSKASLIISTAPDEKDNAVIVNFTRRFNPSAKIIVSAENETEAKRLYDSGADYVILPRFLSGAEIAKIVAGDDREGRILRRRKADLKLIG